MVCCGGEQQCNCRPPAPTAARPIQPQVDLSGAKEAAAAKDLFSVALPALGETSCVTKVGVPGFRQQAQAAPGNHSRASACTPLPAPRLPPASHHLLPSCLLPPPPPPSPSVWQTLLLPFDPEDHEDSDEWRAYEGELSSKELHKARY